MTLQTTGQIKFSEIAAEFGDDPPYSMSEFYAGSGKVNNGTTGTAGIGAVPSSGQIRFKHFYGTQRGPLFSGGGCFVEGQSGTLYFGPATFSTSVTTLNFSGNAGVANSGLSRIDYRLSSDGGSTWGGWINLITEGPGNGRNFSSNRNVSGSNAVQGRFYGQSGGGSTHACGSVTCVIV
jgi:hypothetical protein